MSMKKATVILALTIVALGCRRGEQPVTESTASVHGDAKSGAPKAPAAPAPPAGIEVGATMPEYSAMNLDGSKFDLASKRSKVVLVNVWATWCGPCRFEIPELQRMHDAYAPKGFEVVGVSVDESGVEAVRQFVGEQKMTYPVALDPEGKLANLLQTSVLPTSVLLDRSGKIVWKKYGAIFENDAELKKAIEAAL
jgi:thiol-disulfide isomerase/thioredoxin